MSRQTVHDFIKHAGTDQTIQEKLHTATNWETLHTVAQGAGFDFSRDEYMEVLREIPLDEISDKDLDSVAGGGGPVGSNLTSTCYTRTC